MRGGRRERRADGSRGQRKREIGKCHTVTLKMWVEEGPWAKESDGLQKLEETRQQVLPQSLQKEHSPANASLLAWRH